MATSDSYPLSERCTRTAQLFGILGKLRLPFLAALVLFPRPSWAQWNATIGTQSADLGRQGLAFLPSEIWIHAGESITWTVAADEPHTVTFLTDGQIRPPFTVCCPGFSEESAIFDGSSCVTSAILFKGAKLTVAFPVAGNFKLVCLIHEDMTGIVHVLDPSQPLPHDQEFYDRLAQTEGRALLADRDTAMPKHQRTQNSVTVGGGEIVGTGAGTDTLSVMRFSDPLITVRGATQWNGPTKIRPRRTLLPSGPSRRILFFRPPT